MCYEYMQSTINLHAEKGKRKFAIIILFRQNYCSNMQGLNTANANKKNFTVKML